VGRIFEALEREERENRRNGARAEVWAQAPAYDEVVFDVASPIAGSPEPHLEQYQELRAGLLGRDPRAILFAGTAYGDGVTTTVANFGSVLSGAGRRSVLLIDGDLHAPRLHRLVSPQRTISLEDAIAGNGAFPPVCAERPGLHLISGAPLRDSPDGAGLFQSSKLEELLARSRTAYDYVLIDSPPVQRSSAHWDLWRQADGVVLVLRSGSTRRHVAVRAKRQIEMAGGRLLGLVLNRRRHYIPDWLYRRL
jgi:Mrp family chromosome partitioning ATPase